MKGKSFHALACHDTATMMRLKQLLAVVTFIVCCYALFLHTSSLSSISSRGSLKSNIDQAKNNQPSLAKSNTVFPLKQARGGVDDDGLDMAIQTTLPWWEQRLAKCSTSSKQSPSEENTMRTANTKDDSHNRLYSMMGHCGYRAWSQGPHQKVVSFTLYGNNPQYWQGLHQILNDVRNLYPGWVVRLHTDPRGKYNILCPLLVEYPFFSICDVVNLPQFIGNITHIDPMLWRSAPLGDMQVERFIVRDTDSQLSSREVAAVSEWEASRKLLHVMRDHPQHNVYIMGGMFGVWQPLEYLDNFDRIRRQLFKSTDGDDQKNLARVFLDNGSWLTWLQHSSFNCLWFWGSVPFPTQRQDGFFVGSPMYRGLSSRMTFLCPRWCRPAQHQDWIYC